MPSRNFGSLESKVIRSSEKGISSRTDQSSSDLRNLYTNTPAGKSDSSIQGGSGEVQRLGSSPEKNYYFRLPKHNRQMVFDGQGPSISQENKHLGWDKIAARDRYTLDTYIPGDASSDEDSDSDRGSGRDHPSDEHSRNYKTKMDNLIRRMDNLSLTLPVEDGHRVIFADRVGQRYLEQLDKLLIEAGLFQPSELDNSELDYEAYTNLPDKELANVGYELRKQLQNSIDLVFIQATVRHAADVESLENWNLVDHIMGQVGKWTRKYHGSAELVQDDLPQNYEEIKHNAYEEITLAERNITYLDEHHNNLLELKSDMQKSKDKINDIKLPTLDDKESLQSEVAKIEDDFVRKFFNTFINKWIDRSQQNHKKILFLQENGGPLIEKLNTLIDKTSKELDKAREDYKALEKRKPPEHPFFADFADNEMHRANAKIPFVPRGELSGQSIVHMTRTLLNAQEGVEVPDDKRIAQELGVHPAGYLFDLVYFETNLRSLGDKRGLRAMVTERQEDLEIALSKGEPIGAFLYSSDFGTHPVTLEPFELESNPNKQWVVIHDELAPAPYQVPFEKFVDKWAHVVIAPEDAFESNALVTVSKAYRESQIRNNQ